jgi:hypothetical protein
MLLGIAEIISHRYSERRDKLAEQQQTAAQQQYDRDIARLQAAAADANARAAELEKAAQSAKAEVARANENAAQANERAATIMKGAAWRQLTPDQQQKFSAAISAKPGKVALAWIANDPESLGLAAQLSALFTQARWQLSGEARTYSQNLLWDIWVPERAGAEEHTQILGNAFKAAGIHFITDSPPPHTMSSGSAGGPDFASLIIGSRQPGVLVQPPR